MMIAQQNMIYVMTFYGSQSELRGNSFLEDCKFVLEVKISISKSKINSIFHSKAWCTSS